MSRFSQFSDAGPSSQYESDLPDNLPYLQSDDQLFTPNISYSQPTITSTLGSEFLSPLSVPPSLQRLGPDQKKLWVLYSEMTKDEFILWWLQTQYASQPDRKRIRWDSKHSSDNWKNFDQVAHHATGEPMVMCRRCGKTLPHPQQTANGTNSMRRHFAAGKCRQAGNDVSRQRSIQQSIDHAVRIVTLDIKIILNISSK